MSKKTEEAGPVVLKKLVSTFFLYCLLFFSVTNVVVSANEVMAESEKREIITKRFHDRWNALIEGDKALAYTYESKGYQKETTLEQYLESFSERITWESVEIGEIKFEDEKRVVVTFKLNSVFQMPWGGEFPNVSSPTEVWFYEDNEWWHVRKSTSISDLKP